MIIYQGEQFSRYLYGDSLDYDSHEQIVIAIFDKFDVVALYFVKTPSETYPSAGVIRKSDNPNFDLQIFFTKEMTLSLSPGEYYAEVMRVVEGVEMPIIKGIEKIFTVKKSVIK